MTKWEYTTFTAAYPADNDLGVVKAIDGHLDDNWKTRNLRVFQVLQNLGAHGWELIEVVWRSFTPGGTQDPVCILKRPKED